MRKYIVVLLCIIMVVFSVFTIRTYLNLLFIHENIVEYGNQFDEKTLLSNDGQYILCLKGTNISDIKCVTFYIEKVNENGVVYRGQDNYRAYDFKGAKWDELDVVIASGDVGKIRYVYKNGTWTKNE